MYYNNMLHFHYTEDACPDMELPTELQHMLRRALLIADSKDHVLLTSRFNIEEELEVLHSLGFGPHAENVLYLNRYCGGYYITEGNVQGYALDPFTNASQVVHTVAASLGCRVIGSARDIAVQGNDKRIFQRIINERAELSLGPRGHVCRREEVAQILARYFSQGLSAVVKHPFGASGLGTKVVHMLHDIPDDLPQEVVVQECVEYTHQASVQFTLMSDNELEIPSTLIVTDQCVDGTHHEGNAFPSCFDERVCALMKSATHKVLVVYQQMGLRGMGSVDFLVDTERHLVYATEVNARWTAPRYPLEAAMLHFGEYLPFVMQGVELSSAMGMRDIAGLIQSVLFDQSTRRGCVPFAHVTSRDGGSCYLLAYGKTREDAEGLFAKAQERLLSSV